jgi:hypothetical protein
MPFIYSLIQACETRRHGMRWEARAHRLAIEEAAYRWAKSFGRKASPAS